MVKSAPSLGRIAVMAGFALSCFALVLFLWLAFGGPIPLKPKGYRISASFAEASQLATEADVRISGVPIGKVKAIEPDAATGRSLVTMELEAAYSPLPSDSRALLRQKTLLGETYVELTPGTAQAPKLAEGGRLPQGNVSETVELDEILRTFDPATRAAFQEWMQTQAQAIGGHGRDLNDALGNLGPFAEDAAELVDLLNRQEPAVKRLIADTGVVFEALTERNGQLRELVENSNSVFETTASRDRELQEAFVALPTFEREARQTITRLSQFARDTDPLVDQLRPAARELSPTLIDLSALAPDLKAFFRESNPLIDASKAGFPAAERVLQDLRPLLAPARSGAPPAQPDPRLPRPLQGRLAGFFANTTAATQGSTVSREGPAALPAHDQPVQSGEPGRGSAAAADQPAQPLHAAAATSIRSAAACRPTRLATAAARGSRRSSTRRSRSPPRARCRSSRCRCRSRPRRRTWRTSSTAPTSCPTACSRTSSASPSPAGRGRRRPRRRAGSRRRSTSRASGRSIPTWRPD